MRYSEVLENKIIEKMEKIDRKSVRKLIKIKITTNISFSIYSWKNSFANFEVNVQK